MPERIIFIPQSSGMVIFSTIAHQDMLVIECTLLFTSPSLEKYDSAPVNTLQYFSPDWAAAVNW